MQVCGFVYLHIHAAEAGGEIWSSTKHEVWQTSGRVACAQSGPPPSSWVAEEVLVLLVFLDFLVFVYPVLLIPSSSPPSRLGEEGWAWAAVVVISLSVACPAFHPLPRLPPSQGIPLRLPSPWPPFARQDPGISTSLADQVSLTPCHPPNISYLLTLTPYYPDSEPPSQARSTRGRTIPSVYGARCPKIDGHQTWRPSSAERSIVTPHQAGAGPGPNVW